MVTTSYNAPGRDSLLRQPGKLLRVIGLMSGTSMDGIDVAVMDTDGQDAVVRGKSATFPYAENLRSRLIEVSGRDPRQDQLDPSLARDVTDAQIEAIRSFATLAGVRLDEIDLIGFHGQTIFHDPKNHFTCQLSNGERMADALNIPVVSDFRAADVAAGGEGAPFAPLYHVALAQDVEKPVCVLNLGGVGNVTWISAEGAVIAFDTGPANALLDDWLFEKTGQLYDANGALAQSGQVDEAVLKELMSDPYFSAPFPKSLDRDHFSLMPVRDLSPENGAATLVEFTAASLARAQELLPARPFCWLVTGGGRRNPTLMAALRSRLSGSVDPVEIAGWSGDTLEAEAFAYLAVRSVRGLPLSLPSTTGVPQPTCGGILSIPKAST